MKKIAFLLIVSLWTTFPGLAQTDSIFRSSNEKNYVFGKDKAISRVEIHSEQTNINIQTWNKGHVEAKIVNSSRHPDQTIATDGLDDINFIIEQQRDNLYVRKLIKGAEKRNENSPNLFSELTLMVPEGTVFHINNKVGRVNIAASRIELFGSLELCQLIINSSQLKVNISQNFGETQINNSQIKGKLNLNRVNTSLLQIQGEVEINSQWGSLVLEPTISAFELLASIDKTNLSIRGFSLEDHQILLNSKFTKIQISPDINLNISEDEEGKSLQHSPANAFVNLHIKSNLGEIQISK